MLVNVKTAANVSYDKLIMDQCIKSHGQLLFDEEESLKGEKKMKKLLNDIDHKK